MRNAFLLLLTILSLLAAEARAGGPAPHEIDGFALGANIAAYADRLDMATSRPLAEAPCLRRVDVKPGPGFSSGYLLYGDCAAKGVVVRVKLRYADSGPAILTEINSSLERRYGQPAALRDNADRSYICNKWSLTGENGHAVSLILQHYEGWDPEYDQGSSIKLADRTLIEAEAACCAKNRPGAGPASLKNGDWALPR